MTRWCCLFGAMVLVTTTTASAIAQKLDSNFSLTNSEMTHADDLFIGRAKMTLHYVFDGKQLQKDVIVLFITKDRIIYREKEGEHAKTKTSNDANFIKLVQEMPKVADDRVWAKKDGKIAGPLVPPENIDLTPQRLSKEQLTAFLVERAEVFYDEMSVVLRLQNKAAIEDLIEYASSLKKFAVEEKLGMAVEDLFDLRPHILAQDKLIKQRNAEVDSLKEEKMDAAKQRELAKAIFELRQGNAMIEGLAHGADFFNSKNPGDLLNACAAFGKIGQAAFMRDLDEIRIKEATTPLMEKINQQITNLNVEMQKNRAKLTERLKIVWAQLKLDETIMKSLSHLAMDLIEPIKRDPTAPFDLTATLEVLDRRIRHWQSLGLPSPQLIGLKNLLEAVRSLKPKPADMADRLMRAEDIYQLGRKTIESAKSVPEVSLFDADRIQLLIKGSKLIQQAVEYACEPQYPISEPTLWDIRADFGARVMKMALSRSAVLDPGGHARMTRAALLLHRGLAKEAQAQVENDAKVSLWDQNPAYMLQLTRIACQNYAPRLASDYFQTALRAGLSTSRDLETERDFQPLWTLKPKPKFLIDRDNPNLAVYLSMNPSTVKNNFQTYDIKIVNQGSYPLVGATIWCDVAFTQGFKKMTITSMKKKIEYIGPAGSSHEDYYWSDTFQVSGKISQAFLRVELAPKNPKLKGVTGSFLILQGSDTFYRWRWFY